MKLKQHLQAAQAAAAAAAGEAASAAAHDMEHHGVAIPDRYVAPFTVAATRELLWQTRACSHPVFVVAMPAGTIGCTTGCARTAMHCATAWPPGSSSTGHPVVARLLMHGFLSHAALQVLCWILVGCAADPGSCTAGVCFG
jgi:hypothetical protein